MESQSQVKLSDVIDEVSDFMADAYDVMSDIFWEKNVKQNYNENNKNKWTLSKVLKNVKFGYKTIVDFLPSIEMSREAINNFIPPILANSSLFNEVFEKYIY